MSPTSLAEKILSESTPEGVADAAEGIAGAAMQGIESSMPEALHGDRAQLRIYLDAYLLLQRLVLDAVGKARPDVILYDEARNTVTLLEAKRGQASGQQQSVRWLKAALEQEAVSAPFSEWVGTLGAGRGAAVAFVARLRSMLADTKSLASPRDGQLPIWPLSDGQVMLFYRAVGDELARIETPLERIAAVFGVSRTELARLFGVRRQAIEQWEARGVPAERQEKLATLDAIVDLLTAKLKPDRIPGVLRRPASAYGGRSILEAIAADEQALALDELRNAFDWAAAA
jgi:transcriptional regulator with XRE-family HTH domain